MPINVSNFETDYNIVAENEVNGTTSLVRCDNTISTPSDTETQVEVFDFSRFTHFLKLCNETERQSRLLNLRHGKPVMSISDYSDEVLEKELFALYGHMDTSSSHFRTHLFPNYKEERLEELAEWINEEEDLKNLLKEGRTDVIDLTYKIDPDSVVDLTKTFTENELHAFEEVRKGNRDVEVERFILPRKSTDSTKNETKTVSGATTKIKRFDARMNPPSMRLPNLNSSGVKMMDLLQSLIHSHVTGITVSQFELEFKKSKGYDPDCYVLGYDNFRDMVINLRRIIWPQIIEETRSIFLYPKHIEGLVSTPSVFFRTLVHKFLFILTKFDGVIEVSQSIDEFGQLFGFQLSMKILNAWGFSSQTDFLKCLFKNFCSHNNIKVRQVDPLDKPKPGASKSARPYFYLIRTLDDDSSVEVPLLSKDTTVTTFLAPDKEKLGNPLNLVNRAKGEITSPYKKDLFLPRTIPSSCVQYDEEIEYEFKKLERKRNVPCVLLHFDSPSNFELVLTDNWDKLENFQDSLTYVKQKMHFYYPYLLIIQYKNFLMVLTEINIANGRETYRNSRKLK